MKILLVLLTLAGCANADGGGHVSTSLHGTYSAYGGVVSH